MEVMAVLYSECNQKPALDMSSWKTSRPTLKPSLIACAILHCGYGQEAQLLSILFR